jgi:hypothetical protein
MPAAALLHVVSARADHPSRHDQAARVLDRMGADGHGWRAYVRDVTCGCATLGKVVRCEPKSQTLTSNTCFRVSGSRPTKDVIAGKPRYRRKRRVSMRHIRYQRLLPTCHHSKSLYQLPGHDPACAEKHKNPPNAAACWLRTGFA